MKRYSPPLMAFLTIIITPAMLMAKPSVSLKVPPPELRGVEDLWNVTLQNPDTITYEVWLEGTITEASKGQVFWAKTKPFPLPKGTRIIKFRDIQSIGIEKQTHAPGYEQFAFRQGGLPDGTYEFAVMLEPGYDTKSVEFVVRATGAPRLISPRNGDTIFEPYPVFVWTPPMPQLPEPVTYELRIVEILSGQTPEQAMKANALWFIKKDITTTSFKYPSNATKLTDGKGYCWTVATQGATSGVFSFYFCAVPPKHIAGGKYDTRLIPHGYEHIKSGENATLLIPPGYVHIATGPDKTKCRPKGWGLHLVEPPEYKTKYRPYSRLVHLEEPPKWKTKDVPYQHILEGQWFTRWVPDGARHIPEGSNATRLVPKGRSHITTGNDATKHLPQGPRYEHIDSGDDATKYKRQGAKHIDEGADATKYKAPLAPIEPPEVPQPSEEPKEPEGPKKPEEPPEK